MGRYAGSPVPWAANRLVVIGCPLSTLTWATFPVASDATRTAPGGTAVTGREAMVNSPALMTARRLMSCAATTTPTFAVPRVARPATTVPRTITSRNARTDIPIPIQNSVRRLACLGAAGLRTGALAAMAQRASLEQSVWIVTNNRLRPPSTAAADRRRDDAAGPRFARRLLGIRTSSPEAAPGKWEETRHPPAVVQALAPEVPSEDPVLSEDAHQLKSQRDAQDQGSGPCDGGQEDRPAAHHLAQVEGVATQAIGAAGHQPACLGDDRKRPSEGEQGPQGEDEAGHRQDVRRPQQPVAAGGPGEGGGGGGGGG